MTVGGIVLAAGASRRMGVPKAVLRVGDRTFLDALGEALRSGGCDPVLAVVAEPTEAIRKECRLAGIVLVVNPEPSRGQISSLRCGLEELGRVDGVVVLLVDQGSILPSTVRAVQAALSCAWVAVARYRTRTGHPVGFAREVFPELFCGEVADGGADAVVAAYRRTGRLAEVDVEDPGVIRNLNTPEEYKAFQDHGASTGI